VRRFRTELGLCKVPADRRRLATRSPLLFAIYDLYRSKGALRHAVEARVLAGEPTGAIALKCALPPAVVRGYESLFFDVRDRLKSRDFIHTRVIGPALSACGASSHAVVWKLFGYVGGARVLDTVIGGGPPARVIETDEQVATFFAADAPAVLAGKLAAAARVADVDPRTLAGLLRAARPASGAKDDRPLNNYEAQVRAMLDEIPFSVGPYDPSLLPPEHAHLDEGAYELRTSELLNLSAGQPAHIDAERAAFRFPEPRQRRTAEDAAKELGI
jgi:hypothetical protein